MKISIITPSFNSEKTIERTLNSIVYQSHQPLEVIIIDNASSDQTLAIAKKILEAKVEYKIISEKDQGISDAFSKGVKNSTGEIIGILNSDDEYFDKDVIKRIAEVFENKNIDFVHGDMQFVDEHYGTDLRKPLLCSLTYAMPYNHPSLFLRKKIYDEIGLFRLDYKYAMDFELICRMYADSKNCKYRGAYFDGEPIVKMYGGGASWVHEYKSVLEVERALKEHHFWNFQSFYFQSLRKLRIKIKNLFFLLRLNFIVRVWRKIKWG